MPVIPPASSGNANRIGGTPIKRETPSDNDALIYDAGTGQWNAEASAAGDMSAATYDPAGVEEQLAGLTAAQTLTNKTIDFDNNTVSNIVSDTSDKFAVYRSSDQTMTNSGTWYRVEFDTETYDPGGNYDPTTDYLFLVPTTGVYLVSYKVEITANDSDQLLAKLLIGATSYARSSLEAGAGQSTLTWAGAVSLTAGATVVVQARNNTSAGTAIQGEGGHTLTHWSAHLLST